MQIPETPPAPPCCALCGEPLLNGANFCARCGAESAKIRLSRGGAQFTPINHFWVFLLIAAAFTGVYKVLEQKHELQTYAAFIGLPLLIGILVAYLTRPQAGIGMTLKVTTILLCLVCPLLQEGSICILMAAPIFYTIAVVGYLLITWLTGLLNPRARGGPMALILLPFLAAMLTSDGNHIANPATNVTHDEIFIAAPPETVFATLRHGDLVSRDFPRFLRLGFPLPKKMERDPDGLTRLAFDPGSEAWSGTNVIVSRQTEDAGHRRITFTIEEDGTKLARWMTFRETRFDIRPVRGGAILRQTTVFQQRMQPGLYWNPLQDFAMHQMHGYALGNVKRLAVGARSQ